MKLNRNSMMINHFCEILNEPFNKTKAKVILCGVIICMISMALTGCETRDKIFTVGVVSNIEPDPETWQGFHLGMAELGYIEGKNIKYFINKVSKNNNQNIDAAINELLKKNIDMILSIGREVDLRAKELVKGKDTPVLFGPGSDPIKTGLVESINHPGGNLTGVQGVDCAPKALEFLKDIIPQLKKLYLPYNPNDIVSNDYLPGLNITAAELGIELDLHKIQTVEEVIAAIKNLRSDVDAIFMIPSPTLNSRYSELSNAAINRGIPTGAGLLLDNDVLITFCNDYFSDGKMMALQAQKILDGVRPSDIPIETGEVELIINLKTAEKIGISIPTGILIQADVIIR